MPYTILRATQFFEFVGGIVQSGIDGDVIRLSPALFQPIASDDVAATLAEVAVAPPVNGTIEVAGPEAIPLDKIARQFLAAKGDGRSVIADVHARYFGAAIDQRSLADPRRESAPWPNPFRGLAQPLIARESPGQGR